MSNGSKNFLNPNYRRKKPSAVLDVPHLFEGIRKGDRTALGQGITLIESEKTEHRIPASELLGLCLPVSGKSKRIGITGVPGAGKSTFINAFGTYLTSLGHQVAVLAIDPSSGRNKGSILGDKTRMDQLSVDPKAFIRPSPSGGSLGGVAAKTRESILLCEAAGYDIILIETVGVGQSETEVHSMVDMFLLLLIAGGGDELQGIKRGIMEMTDLLIITKDDGSNQLATKKSKTEYASALHLFPASPSKWIPQVETVSSLENKGLDKIKAHIDAYFNLTQHNGYFQHHRSEQSVFWMHRNLNLGLLRELQDHPACKALLPELEEKVRSGTLSPLEASRVLLETFKKN
jgi:LAO/AO transport system kinase